MAAVLLWPEVTVNGTFDAVELVITSEGLQSGVLEPSVVKANASIVYVTGPALGGEGVWLAAGAKAPTLGFIAGTIIV